MNNGTNKTTLSFYTMHTQGEAIERLNEQLTKRHNGQRLSDYNLKSFIAASVAAEFHKTATADQPVHVGEIADLVLIALDNAGVKLVQKKPENF